MKEFLTAALPWLALAMAVAVALVYMNAQK